MSVCVIDLAAARSEHYYHYLIVRADLPVGVKLAQTVHAAGISASEWSLSNNLPIHPETRAVALEARDEAHLLDIEQRLLEAGIPFNSFREPDAPYFGAVTALGIHPTKERGRLYPITGGLPLVT